MRLTLRTLLAYLDDTLEPLEIKKIGQKVGESDTAQELIARIKQVTRRRRITTPPATGPNSFDPNTVADYLDSELPPEQVAELEKICLESDVHLAEVASCHQILTLVLGEPAAVPPTAKERMYALVQGREAIPFRKASTAEANASVSASGDHDADEMFLLGLPFYRRGSWLRWALPLAGVVLLAVIGVALWQSVLGVQRPDPSKSVASNRDSSDKKDPTKPDETKDVAKPDDKKTEVNPIDKKDVTKPDDKKDEPKPDDKKDEPKPDDPKADPAARKAPSNERAEVGSYFFDSKSLLSILVQGKQGKQEKQDGWRRLTPSRRVSTVDPLVSLPGYASEVRLDSGVRLLLRGHVPEFSLFSDMDYLQESAVVLHKPDSKGVDADVLLRTGRLYISNHKDSGAVVVRLRLEKEVWELTLKEPGAEVVVDLLKRYRGDVNYLEKGAEPVATLHLFLLKGNAGLAADYQQFPALSEPPGPAYFVWNNKGAGAGLRGPVKQDKVPPFFAPVLPVDPNKNPNADKMEQALKQLSLRMPADKDPTVVLQEVLQKNDDPNDYIRHRLAIYCLGALDEIGDLLDVLGDTDPIRLRERETAIFTLRRWLGRDAENGPKLFNPETKTGILKEKKMYTTSEAETIFALLHDFSEEEIFAVETYDKLARDLVSTKVAIAELARWHLYRLAKIQGVNIPSLDKFNAAAPRDVREVAYTEVKDKIDKGDLPLRPSLSGQSTSGAPKNGTPPPSKNPTRPGPKGNK
jgi:hypothetical protein